MNSISESEDALVEELNLLSDWTSKYEYIIEFGRELPEMDKKYKDNSHLIKGCQSSVWLMSETRNGLVYFSVDSDAIIVKGLVALLIVILSGQSPKEICNSELKVFDKIGLNQHLSPSRSNGIIAVIKQMKADAMKFYTKEF